MSFIILSFIILLLLVYLFLIENYRRWFIKLKPFTRSDVHTPVFFSVIIPARNEEDNIADCLFTILNQNYSTAHFEVIVVDDFSSDNTASIVQSLQKKYTNLHLLELEKMLIEKQLNSYKKKAIDTAIQHSKGDWIITTDADCYVSKDWLLNFASFINQYNPVFIAAPVKFTNSGSFVSIFQSLDFMSLQGITAASVAAGFHTMCNGANLAYSKKVFEEVGGFQGIDNIASGDDMLLMHKIYKQHPAGVQYLHSSSSIVQTEPMPTWKDFLNQRIRWASKADKFQDKRIFWVLAFIYLLNLSFVILPFLTIWYKKVWCYWFGMLIAKTLIELRFMIPVANFYNEQKLLWWFPIMQPVHILYTVVAGWLGKFGKYTWKGRTVK